MKLRLFSNPALPYRLIVALLALGVLWQCRSRSSATADTSTGATQPDAFAHKTSVRHARNFSVSYHGNYKLVRLSCSAENRNMVTTQYVVLVQRGTPKPTLPDSLADAQLIEIPVRTAAANDDGDVMRIATLGFTNALIAMGGGGIYDTTLRKRWEQKKIASIGYSFHSAPAPELILTLKPDVLFLYTYDHERLKAYEKLRQLGTGAVPVFAWQESSFLGKAEWIKLTALFFNAEQKADSLFTTIEQRCQELTKTYGQQRPQTTVFSYYPRKSPGIAHRNDFIASYFPAAGGLNLLADEGPHNPVEMTHEQVYALAKDADVWIVGDTSDVSWPPTTYLNGFKAYRTGRVYTYQGRVRPEHDAYDWYETADVRPDLVLADLAAIFYPKALPDHRLFFFKKVLLTKGAKTTN
ncbi:ABC transporter substrate-binding protein [Spirosoma aerolatum]|uniref:ABC transporter substrate-binding protein n=1 Tax=Spirosoma aerolatum TaxID=1211326 RepID=UPI0009AC3470|nr:ABC transporter substrate-binding protein [Spirosoma aerolatum]